jgi:hypothetical protein
VSGILGFGVYGYCLHRAVHSAANSMIAHLIVIQESGISPMTTPVFWKYPMLRRYFYIVIISCISLIVVVILGLFINTVLWLPRLFDSIVDGYIGIVLAWMAHFRKEKEGDYDNEGVQAKEEEGGHETQIP